MKYARATVEIARASLRVLRAHPRLLWFPALSALSVMAAAVLLLGPAVDGLGIPDLLGVHDPDPGETSWLAGILAYTVVNGVAAFFCVALTHQCLVALRGDAVSVEHGLRYAVTRTRDVGVYAAINATLGAILSGGRGVRRRASSMLGIGWELATYLALPVMVQERRGAVDSLRRSGRLFQQTWGETALSQIGLRVVALQFFLLLALLCVVLAHLFDEPALPIAFFGLVLGLGFGLLVAALQGIFRAALYIFAAEGVVPDAFDTPELHDVWRVK